MANALTYIKNVGKSVTYASFDVLKEKNPVFQDFAETNGELAADMYKSVKDLKKNIKDLPNKIIESDAGKFAKSFRDNLFEDLKTGKFYNKERKERYDEEAAMEMLGEDIDLDVFDDFGNADLKDLDEDIPDTNEMMDIVGEKSSNAVSTAVARSAEYIVEANSQTARANYKQMNAIYGGIHSGMSTINQNISKILEFSNENMNLHFENSKTFYTEITKMDQERNQYLKEISDNIKQLNATTTSANTSSRKSYSDLVSYEGVLDLNAYKDHIKKNIKSSDGGITDIVGMMLESGAFKTLAASPLEYALAPIINSIIPKALDKSMETLNKSISSLFGNILMNLKNKAQNSDNEIWSIISSIFGINTDLKTSIDPSKYEKGRVPFDGITRKAITEVIPTYLSKILSVLNGQKRDTFDYDTGKFVTVDSLKNKISNNRRSSAERAASDLDSIFNEEVKKLKLNDEELESLKSDWKNTKQAMFNKQKRFETRDKSIEAYDYDIIDDNNFEILKKMFDGRVENLNYPNKLYREISSFNRSIENLQGSIAMNSQFNDSDKFEMDDKKTGISSIFGNVNNAIIAKLEEIHKELSFIRLYGGGRSKNSKRAKKVRPDLSNFTIPKTQTMASAKESETESNKTTESTSSSSSSDDSDVGDITDKEQEEQNKTKKKKTLSDKIKSLKMGALGILQGPLNYTASIIDKVDARLYDLVFGPKEGKKVRDEDDDRSLSQILFDNLQEQFNNFSEWMHEHVFDPLKYKSIKENAHDAAAKFLKIFGIDLDKSVEGIKKFLFGEDEDGNRTKGGFLGKFVNDFKDTFKSVGNWIKDGFKELGEETGTTAKKNEKGQNKDKINKALRSIEDIGKVEKDEDGNVIKNPDGTNKVKTAKDAVDGILNAFKKESANIDDIAPNAAAGAKRVNKTGLAVISEGEMIIPPDMNPLNIAKRYSKERAVKKNLKDDIDSIFEYAEGSDDTLSGEDKNKQDKEISDKEKLKQAGINLKNIISEKQKNGEDIHKYLSDLRSHYSDEDFVNLLKNMNLFSYEDSDYEEGRTPIFSRILDEYINAASTSAKYMEESIKENFTVNDKDVEKFKTNAKSILGDIKENGGTLAAGATIGAGVSLVTGLIGGPLVGAAVGAGTALLTKSKTFQDLLFGNEEENKKGLLPQNIAKTIKKYIPDMAKSGAMGALMSIIPGVPGGPVTGIIVGSALGFAKNNETIQNHLFGEGKLLGKKEDFQKKVKSVLPKMGAGAAVGLLAGPFGLTTNILLGSALGFATDTNKFKDTLFGEKGEDGKRDGGIFQSVTKPMANFFKELTEEFKEYIKKDILAPIKSAIDPLKKQFSLMAKGITDFIGKLLKDHIVIPIEKKLQKFLIDPISKGLKKIFNPVKGLFKKTFSFIPKLIGGAGDLARMHQIKTGNADYMSAEERVAYRQSKGWKMLFGNPKGDIYSDLDKSMVGMDNDKLNIAKTAMSGIIASTKDTDELKRDAFKNVSKALKSKDVDYNTSKAVKKMIENSDYDGAKKFVEQKSGIQNDKVRNNLLDTIDKSRKDIETHYAAKEDRDGTMKNIGDTLRKAGFNLDDKSIERLSKSPKEAQKILDMITAQEKYNDDHDIEKTEEQKTQQYQDDIKDKTQEIIDLLKKLVYKDKKEDENNKEGENDNKDNKPDTGDEKKNNTDTSTNEDEDSEIDDRYENLSLFEKVRRRFRNKGPIKGALGLGKDIISHPVKGAFKLGTGALGLGFKGLKAGVKEGLGLYDALRDTPFFTKMWGDRYVDYNNPGERKDIPIHESKILNWFKNRKTKENENQQFEVSEPKVDPVTGLNIVEAEPTVGGKIRNLGQKIREKIPGLNNLSSKNIPNPFKNMEKMMAKMTGVVLANAYNDGVDIQDVDDKADPKTLFGKIKNKFKKASNTVTQFFNGRPVKFRKDKNGDLIPDNSSAENKEYYDELEEEKQTQKGILSTISSIPSSLGGLFSKLFGQDKDKDKKSFLEKIWEFFTGSDDENSGKKSLWSVLKKVLKTVLPTALLALGISGKLDNIFSALTNGAYGSSSSNDKITITDDNGNVREIMVDTDGNPITDVDGNYITKSGEVTSGEQKVQKHGSLANMSVSDRLIYNGVRNTLTGRSSIISAAVTKNPIAKTVSKITKPATKATTSTISKIAQSATDVAAKAELTDKIIDSVTKWSSALKKVPGLGKYADKLDDLGLAVADLAEDYLPKAGEKLIKAKSLFTKINLVVLAATAVVDFTTGWQDASTILKIKKENVTTPQKIVCGLVRTIKNFIPIIGTFIPDQLITDLFINHVAGWFGIDTSEIKKQQEEAQAELKAYNDENNTDYSWNEYNKVVLGNYTWTEKIGNKISSAVTNAKQTFKNKGYSNTANVSLKDGITNAGNWVKDKAGNIVNGAKSVGSAAVDKVKQAGGWVKDKVTDFTSSAVTAVSEKFNIAKDLGSYAVNVVKDIWDEMMSGKEKDSSNLIIQEDDPYASHKKIIYNTVKILGFLPSSIAKIARSIWDKLQVVFDGIKTIGNGLGSSVKNQLSKAWSGDIIGAFTDSSANLNTGNGLVDNVSKVVNFIPKVALAVPTLITGGIGNIVKGIPALFNGIKTIGSSLGSSVKNQFSKAWSGDITGAFTDDSANLNTDNELLNGISKVVNFIPKVALAVPTLITGGIGEIIHGIKDLVVGISKASKISSADQDILDKSNEGEISVFSKEYWKVNTELDGIAGGFNTFLSYMKKIFNIPTALLAQINPLKLIEKGRDWILNKLGINDSETKSTTSSEGKGSGLYVGRGSEDDHQIENPEKVGFISQVDPRYKNKRFNTNKDSQVQTLGDSGCAPAAAAMAINSTVNGRATSMEDASKNALKYKVKNDGVSASYFGDEFSRHGLNADYTESPSEIKNQLMNNNKVVLMGQDKSNKSKANSPFGPNPHYVVANGMSMDGKSIYINDPEARTPNIKYSANKILNSSKLGVAANVGRGSSAITSRLRKYIGRGTYGSDTVQYKVWNSLRAAGYSEIATAAAMGNIQHESGFNVSAIEKSTGKGFGLIQWTGARRTAIENYAKQKGVSPTNLGIQIEYLLIELQPNSGVWASKASSKYNLGSLSRNDWANGSDLTKATKAFMCCFEIPSYDPNINHISKRIQSAKEYYEAFTGTSIDVNLDLSLGSSSTYSSDTSDDSNESLTTGTGILSKITSLFTKLASAFGLVSDSSDEDNNTTYSDYTSTSTSTDASSYYNGPANGNVSSNANNAKLQRALVNKMYSVQGQLKYAQDNSKYPGSRNPENGSGDCSSTVQWAYKNILGVDPGSNTSSQRNNPNTYTVATSLADESKLQLGDLLLQQKSNGGGHVEMYAGNNTMIGHGGGKDGSVPGPTVKTLSKSSDYNLVRRYIGFKNNSVTNSNMSGTLSAKGSGLSTEGAVYDNALHYISAKGTSSILPFKISDNTTNESKITPTQYNSNKVSEDKTVDNKVPFNISNSTEKSQSTKTDTTSDNNIIVIAKSMLKVLLQIAANTEYINNISELLTTYLSVSEKAEIDNTEESKNNAKVAKLNLINAMQNAKSSSSNESNLQLQRLIESVERVARE